MAKNLLPEKSKDISEWYTSIVRLADLADYGPTKGAMIIKPYGYALWELVQQAIDPEIKKQGVENAYFPIFIPMSFLQKEKDHIEGFAPELAVVTHAGGEKLEEPLVVRPTSETIIYDAYSRWVQSWRDLPVAMNQWCNVVRWEKRTMPFIRTSEFLWQEGHTAHATHQEAVNYQAWAINMYAKVYRDYFALDGYVGWKSTAERFAGADSTLTYESLMPSGKTLQSCTSHDFGQNFAKPFGIKFQNKEGSESHVWQTSWGLSTRSIGGLIIGHGDDNGLVLPPKLAPVQLVIIPVKLGSDIEEYCKALQCVAAKNSVQCKLDNRDDESFGFRMNKWEVKGAPLIAKIGGREQEQKTVTLKRRVDGKELVCSFDDFATTVQEQLKDIQSEMLAKSRSFISENTREAKDYNEFKKILAEHKGFIKVCWNDNPEVEKKIKEETKAKTSCRPVDWPEVKGVDFYTGEPASQYWLFAQSY